MSSNNETLWDTPRIFSYVRDTAEKVFLRRQCFVHLIQTCYQFAVLEFLDGLVLLGCTQTNNFDLGYTRQSAPPLATRISTLEIVEKYDSFLQSP